MQKIKLKLSENSDMDVYHAMAAVGPIKTPGLIILQEAFGINSHIKSLVERYSKLGYFAVAPELYHRTGPSFTCGYGDFMTAAPHIKAMTNEGIIADVQACFDWLKNDLSIKNIAAVGYCLGGRAAYLANSQIPLKAAVSYYGGRIYPDLLNLAEKQKAPLLLFWGGLDTHIPAEHYQGISIALTSAKKDFTEVVFSQAQHGFSCDERASYNPLAEQQSWALTQQFLKNYLQD